MKQTSFSPHRHGLAESHCLSKCSPVVAGEAGAGEAATDVEGEARSAGAGEVEEGEEVGEVAAGAAAGDGGAGAGAAAEGEARPPGGDGEGSPEGAEGWEGG